MQSVTVLLSLLTTMIALRGAARAFSLPTSTRTTPRLFSSTLLQQNASVLLRMAKSSRTTDAATSSTITTGKRRLQRQQQQPKGDPFWYANTECWRPTVNDVERISWGKPARRKGMGSRGVPHRLNEEERFLFDQARRKGFLEVAGSGWRSQRRDAPLLNSYRSLCDAHGRVVIMVHKQLTTTMTSGGSTTDLLLLDRLVVDLSPLRAPETYNEIAAVCLEQQEEGEIISGQSSSTSLSSTSETDENSNSNESNISQQDETTSSSGPWETRPIYHIDPYYIVWQLPRADAKALGKKLATLFDTAEGSRRAPSKKPIGVKPGKSRRHGGYGIG